MRFPCKGCGVELENPQVDLLLDREFFWQECPECGAIKKYSWLRIQQTVQRT